MGWLRYGDPLGGPAGQGADLERRDPGGSGC